jgi:hypothetical protein
MVTCRVEVKKHAFVFGKIQVILRLGEIEGAALTVGYFDLVGGNGCSSYAGVEDDGIEISPIWPVDGAEVWMYTQFSKPAQIFECGKDAFKSDDARKVKFSSHSVFKPEVDSVAV